MSREYFDKIGSSEPKYKNLGLKWNKAYCV